MNCGRVEVYLLADEMNELSFLRQWLVRLHLRRCLKCTIKQHELKAGLGSLRRCDALWDATPFRPGFDNDVARRARNESFRFAPSVSRINYRVPVVVGVMGLVVGVVSGWMLFGNAIIQSVPQKSLPPLNKMIVHRSEDPIPIKSKRQTPRQIREKIQRRSSISPRHQRNEIRIRPVDSEMHTQGEPDQDPPMVADRSVWHFPIRIVRMPRFFRDQEATLQWPSLQQPRAQGQITIEDSTSREIHTTSIRDEVVDGQTTTVIQSETRPLNNVSTEG